jgi:hypothetical protein
VSFLKPPCRQSRFDEGMRRPPPVKQRLVGVFAIPCDAAARNAWARALPSGCSAQVAEVLGKWEIRLHRLACGHAVGPYLIRRGSRQPQGMIVCRSCSLAPRQGIGEVEPDSEIAEQMRRPEPQVREVSQTLIVPCEKAADILPADVRLALDGWQLRLCALSCGHLMGPYLLPPSATRADSRVMVCWTCQRGGGRLRAGNSKTSTGTSRP